MKHSIEVAQLSGLLGRRDRRGCPYGQACRSSCMTSVNPVDHEMEGSHIQIGADLVPKVQGVTGCHQCGGGPPRRCRSRRLLIACIVQAADTISAARPGARRETLETYTNRLKQLEDIANNFKGVDKSFAIQAGREIRIMVVPEQVSDDDMILLARDISKQIETDMEYPGQVKVNVIRESRVVDYAK